MNVEFAPKYISPAEIFSMREVTVDDLSKVAEKLKVKAEVEVIDHQKCGPFDYYAILSGQKTYEITRMETFVKCTCQGFELGHVVCKHIASVLPLYCRTCFKRPAQIMGGQCGLCGPGELLPLGVRFKCKKYFGARALFEVVKIDDLRDQVCCVDTALPDNPQIPRPIWDFNRLSLDLYRKQGDLKIVDKIELGLEK